MQMGTDILGEEAMATVTQSLLASIAQHITEVMEVNMPEYADLVNALVKQLSTTSGQQKAKASLTEAYLQLYKVFKVAQMEPARTGSAVMDAGDPNMTLTLTCRHGCW